MRPYQDFDLPFFLTHLKQKNFSQPFTSFWDRLLGSMWQPADSDLVQNREGNRDHAE
jgi:sterol desaturase/sphingolipid hydroxylase (fatty acid hydroxylase superfamily)